MNSHVRTYIRRKWKRPRHVRVVTTAAVQRKRKHRSQHTNKTVYVLLCNYVPSQCGVSVVWLGAFVLLVSVAGCRGAY